MIEAGEVLLASPQGWQYYRHPQQVIRASRLDEVQPALARIERLVEQHGWTAAGFLGYEASPAFEPAARTHPPGEFPLLWFGLYQSVKQLASLPVPAGEYQLGEWRANITEDSYTQAIQQIKHHIAAGDTYQVNFTMRLRTAFRGDELALFHALMRAQPSQYAALLHTGRYIICSASPELFFERHGEAVTCRPMKGTAPRGRTSEEDAAQSAWLTSSEKDRAENVMIVDMLRNDLGRIAHTGSVRVPQLFHAERYRTLWQMTSTVTAHTAASFPQLMAALFPCASITGAPKLSTMRIIHALEDAPRHVYTGCIGMLAPGRQARFNVAIRTVLIDQHTGDAEYGVGGGVVWDSTAAGEYAEALLKAQVILAAPPQFDLLETMRWTPEAGFPYLAGHLARLERSAAFFDYPFDEQETRRVLHSLAEGFGDQPRRVRLTLSAQGQLAHTIDPLPPTGDQPLRVCLAQAPIDAADRFFFHKTTQRAVYEAARLARPGFDDVLLFNANRELTEFTIGNLVAEIDGALVTPPLDCGLLPGVLRASLLQRGEIFQQVIRIDDLPRCTRLYRINALRGWQAVELVR